jgi:hypothetical protein
MQLRAILFGLLTAAAALFASADAGTYLTREAFIAQAFGDAEPAAAVLWIDADTRSALARVLGHAPAALRVRYWTQGERTAWILDEIGKERPITMGVVVKANAIERFDVLAFRESRGWEIRYPFFTRQFAGARVTDDGRLDRNIDGITGATLSVGAAKRVAAAALLLDARVRSPATAPASG